jgi:hypothetical protein
MAHLTPYLRVSGCHGWSEFQNGAGIDGTFHHHHDEAIRHLSPAHLRAAVNRASLGAIASKSASGTGSKTGSNENQGVEQGPVRITEPSEISPGIFGGAGRVRTAASQFCRLLP